MRRALLVTLLALAPACAAPPAQPVHAARAQAPASPPHAAQTFGQPVDEQLSTTSLADLLATPHGYEGRIVKTEGTVARVCQRAGCWMELRDDEDGPAVRVPMAGHSFFLPRDAAGKHAVVEGRVVLADLTPDVRAHLESEGALATRNAFSIEAIGVELR